MTTAWMWPKPELTRAGQVAFWDRQAPNYESADMTVDNPHEIAAVIGEIEQGDCAELITLGGAVGCRDPKMILEQIFCSRKGEGCVVGVQMPKVVFNDLAPQLVDRAKAEILAPCRACGVQIRFFTGPIHEVNETIGPGRRRLLLGIYTTRGFFNVDEAKGYARSGFDEYMKNRELLGDHFWFEWLLCRNGQLEIRPTSFQISAEVSETEKGEFKDRLYRDYVTISQPYGLSLEPFEVLAIQVVSAHRERDGFFVSHWYNPWPILGILQRVFPPDSFGIRHKSFPKGMLYIVEPKTPTTGAITMLNNVLGNILPNEQLTTLESVKSLM